MICRHLALPYANNRIATCFEVLILCLIAFLLGQLPFGQWLEAWMAMPIVAIGLNNSQANAAIDRELAFDDWIALIGGTKRIENRKQLLLKLGWVFAATCLPRISKYLGRASRSIGDSALFRTVVVLVYAAGKSIMNIPAPITSHGHFLRLVDWLRAKLFINPFRVGRCLCGICACLRAGEPSMYLALSALKWFAADLAGSLFPSRASMRFEACLRAIVAFAFCGARVVHHVLLAAVQTGLERIACGVSAFLRAKSKPLFFGGWDLNCFATALALHRLHTANYTRRLFYCMQWEGK